MSSVCRSPPEIRFLRGSVFSNWWKNDRHLAERRTVFLGSPPDVARSVCDRCMSVLYKETLFYTTLPTQTPISLRHPKNKLKNRPQPTTINPEQISSKAHANHMQMKSHPFSCPEQGIPAVTAALPSSARHRSLYGALEGRGKGCRDKGMVKER